MEFLRDHQLSIMLYMSGICGVLTLMTFFIEFLSGRRKCILAIMAFSAMMLLLFDRFSYVYRGDLSQFGFLMVRLSNGLVFFLSIFIPHMVTQYLKDVFLNEGHLESSPAELAVCDGLFIFGSILIAVTQFTGLYYTIDAQNIYHRSPGFILSYFVPFLMVLLQAWTIIHYRKPLNNGHITPLLICIILPTAVSIVQIFFYGLSLTNIAMVIVIIVFYVFALTDLGRAAARAKEQEVEFYKRLQQQESTLFEQTAEALVNAIDAKDRYTHGHSTRVADLSRQIAAEAGFSDRDCDLVYFSALLHDVGKIGVPDEIINKPGRLTDEEFDQVKRHPILGNQILSSIKQSPSLSIGAHYHHERYDGTGYPEGLRGENIPEVARIIAVADAYDAMSSSRSYRGALPEEKTKSELADGMGTQFDPRFAQILLHIIDQQ